MTEKMGIKTFAVLSNGEFIDAPDYAKLNRKIRRAQRVLSRRQKGSKRRELARLRVAKLKAKLRDTRKDFLHKLSTRLIRENQVICLGDLNVSGMVKNRCLSRAISEAVSVGSTSLREVVCMNCGTHHDRDGNASKNIEQVGVGQSHHVKRALNECKTPLRGGSTALPTRLVEEQLCLIL